VEKESTLASFEDIEKNDFNLNIPRYVDNFEKEEEIDLSALLEEMSETDKQIAEVQGELAGMLKELTSEDESIMSSLNDFIRMIGG
jgi:type I restriction enzyme M protein